MLAMLTKFPFLGAEKLARIHLILGHNDFQARAYRHSLICDPPQLAHGKEVLVYAL